MSGSTTLVHSLVPLRTALAIAGALQLAAATGCSRDDSSRRSVEWTTTAAATDGSVPVVGGEIPSYVPPPYVDLDRLNALLRMTALPEDASVLVGSEWEADDPPPGEPSGIAFYGNLLTVSQRDGRTMSMVADYSATHPRCHGYPLCITTLNTNGALAVNFLHLEGGALRFAECMVFEDGGPAEGELAAANAVEIYRNNGTVCFYYTTLAEYLPPYETAEEIAADLADQGPSHDDPAPGSPEAD